MRELLSKISEHNVVVEVVDGKLKIFAKQGNIAPELLASIKEQKEELIRFLSGNNQQQFNESLKTHIPAVAPAESYVLSSGQRRMWVLSQFEQGSIAYNMGGSYVFEGNLDRAAFEKAFHTLMERHENLRTIFKEEDEEEVRQYILPVTDTGFSMQYIDLRQDPNPSARLNELLQWNKMQPYDLAQGPLVRAVFYQMADAQWVFGYGLHHIISDGWSNGVMVHELLVLYNAFSKGQPNPLPPLRIQYKDYAAWQRAQLAGESLQRHADYWKKQFEGELPILNLPGDHPRPAVKTYNGGIHTHHFGIQTSKAFKTWVQEQGCTLFMGAVALVNALLYRYTGQEDIILGTPIAGREHADLHNQIGLYINTLALRTQFKGSDHFKSLLGNVKQMTLGAYQHQVYPFDELVDDLKLQRDVSRSALFDVMVVFQNNEQQVSGNGTSEQQMGGGVNVGGYNGVEHVISKLDLTFTFEELGEELYYSIQYNSDIFTNATVERIAQHLNSLAAAALAQPLTPVQRLDYIPAAEKGQLLQSFNDTALDFPQHKTIADIFEEQVVLHPQATAVVFGDTMLNYAQMNGWANQLAAHLRQQYDIQPDDRVGFCLQRSHWLMVVVWGILKSGGGYVPIDPDYPQERIDFMVADSGCKALIDQAFLDGFLQVQSQYSTDNLPSLATPNSLAYIIYTSGSTGMPKGVMITHRNIVNYATWFTGRHEMTASDASVFLSSIAFDGILPSIYGAYTVGGSVHILSKEMIQSPILLADYLYQQRITFLKTTPSQIKMLVADEAAFSVFVQCDALRLILSGGEAMNRADIQKVQAHASHIVVANHYGPTETTIGCISAPVTHAQAEIPVGKPIGNTQVFILDPLHQLVPIGFLGEICIGGNGLARGYLNNPELTADKYVDNPFRPGERMYKTGDIGRWQPDGHVLFMGRRDHQVKIRGYRIELGEIESALQRHPDISAAVVMARADQAGENELAAYIIGSVELNVSNIRNYLKTQLPDYMVPTQYVQMEVFPLSSSGKVDRKQLPDPAADGQGMRTGVEYVTPRNKTEEILLGIWSEVLNHAKEKISVKDNFFELGGHSLKATRLVGRIFKELDVKLPLQDLFIHPVLEEQAALIERTAKTRYSGIDVLPPQTSYALSSSQRRLWVLSQFEEGNVAYNMPGSHVFPSGIDRQALAKAFEALMERHESLRTIFKEDEHGEVRQFILPANDTGFQLLYEDLRGTEQQAAQVAALLQHQAAQPFDLAQGPLVRAALYEIDGGQLVLGYVLHHIISDGMSMSILINEVMQLYMALSMGQTTIAGLLPPLRIQYKDYAAWQLQQLEGEQLKVHEGYWLQQFEGELPVLDLPGDKKRPAVKTYNGGSVAHYISPELTIGLKKLAQAQGSTLFMGLLAAVNALLYKYTGQDDIIIGTQIAGRGHADLENQIGFYLNTLALRTRLDTTQGFNELLNKVKETTLGAFAHQIYPFDELVNALPLRRDLGRNALFDVSVILHNIEQDAPTQAPATPAGQAGIPTAGGVETGSAPSSKFDLAFGFTETEGGLMANLVFNSDIYLPETAVRMMAHLQQILQAVVHRPWLSLEALDLLTPEEKEQQLHAFNATKVDYPRHQTIIGLFEEQVVQRPDHPAVVYEGNTLTYGQLNEQANLLAAYLLAQHNVQPEDKIGVLLHKSELLIVAILGILKTGAAYVPLDVELPEARKKYIMEDTGIQVLLTLAPFAETVPFFGGSIVTPEEVAEAMTGKEARNLDIALQPDLLAYIMYTSGSTGKPKGVMIEHRAVIRLVKQTNYIHFTGEEALLSTGAISFDATTFEYWGMLLNGGKLVMGNNEVLLDAAQLANLIQQQGVNTLFLTTGWLNQLVERDLGIFGGLRTVLTGGDRASYTHIRLLRERYPHLDIVNLYGPTENTVVSTYYKVEGLADEAIPIGKPISNSTVYIVNEQGQLVPTGMQGEICVGGDGLARGYWNRPELTAEKFVPNPWVPGERMYRTGDIGRWLPDGNIAFMGRRDDQVKVRGYRIELGEIETALQGHPAIDTAVVLALTGRTGEKELVAYIVATETLNASALGTYLSANLPSYMVPAYFVQLDVLPLNANGKVDKKALPDPQGIGLGSGVEYVAPTNETEERLVQIWQEILGREKIGIKDNFFDLGGHSLKATQLISKITTAFGVGIGIKTVFLEPTIESIAQRIVFIQAQHKRKEEKGDMQEIEI
jgi:amino acid adenylation domain-containing protein